MYRQLLTRSCFVDFDGPASGSSPNSSSNLPSACPSRRGGRRGCGVGVQVAVDSDNKGHEAAVGHAKKRLAAIAGVAAIGVVVLVSTAKVSRGCSNIYFSRPLFVGKKTSVELYSAFSSVVGASAGTLASSSSSAAAAAAVASVENSTTPIVIALLNRFYFGDRYARPVPGCTKSNGESLSCEFTAEKERFDDAEALA